MASNGVDVYVKMPSGRCSQYDVRSTQTITKVCALVAKDEGVDTNCVRLKYQGKTLDGNKTVGQYGVRAETILKVEILVPKSLDLVVELPEERGVDEVIISNLQPVSALFDMIADKLDVDKNKLQLQIAGKPLTSSSSSLMDTGVVGGSTIVVKYKPLEEKTKNSPSAVDQLDTNAREEILSSFDTQGRNVEVVFSFDTTGSMYSYLTEVRSKLKECCRKLLQEVPNIRIGIIAHGDYCDDNLYVVKQNDLTSDLETLVDFTTTVETTSGGDCPECYEWVLRKAQQLDWADDSAKALVIIGDDIPHPPSYTDQRVSWRDELELLKGMDIKVYGVQAGNNSAATNFYKEMSEVSGGCYISLGNIDVITDMFLAVCYRESDDAMLDHFEEEVTSKGDMTEAKKEMFTQLKQKENNTKDEQKRLERNQRYVSAPWWDLTLDTGIPQYTYDRNKDKWSIALRSQAQVSGSGTTTSARSTTSSTRRKTKRKCSIM